MLHDCGVEEEPHCWVGVLLAAHCWEEGMAVQEGREGQVFEVTVRVMVRVVGVGQVAAVVVVVARSVAERAEEGFETEV